MVQAMGQLGTFALAYAQRLGWFVFPLQPHGKRPLTLNGFKDASNDPEQIVRWWFATPNANIGLDCERSNTAVIDLDGATGIANWNKKVDSLGLVHARCAVQQTGGGGSHLVYRQRPGKRIRNTSSKLAECVDSRGDGGYIVLAPSVHVSGGVYMWIDGFSPRAGMDELPEVIADLLIADNDTPTERQSLTIPKFPSRALFRGYERVAYAIEGTRNDTLNRVAFYLYSLIFKGEAQLGIDDQDVTETLTAAAHYAGLPENEARATLRSARKAAML